MSSEILHVHLANDTSDLTELIDAILRGAAARDDVLQACHLYRRMGIASLLMSADPAGLHLNLFKSGRLHLHWLRRAREEEKLSGRFDPLLDAVACLDEDGVRETAARSRTTHDPEMEYEEDALFARIVHGFFLRRGESELRPLLERYEEVLEGAFDVRLLLAKALLDRDPAAFEEALGDFVDDWERRYRSAREEGSLPEGDLDTESHVSIEGVAWMRLADRSGLALPRNHRFIPDLALEPVSLPNDPEAWRTPKFWPF